MNTADKIDLPDIYRQPVNGLSNFEMSGDSLAVVKDCMNRINQHENDPSGPPAKKSSTRAAADTKSHS